jgi:prevent-host-death family protein
MHLAEIDLGYILLGMTSVTTVAARRQLADLINRVRFTKERILLTRYGQELAALVPVEDLRLLRKIRSPKGRRSAKD